MGVSPEVDVLFIVFWGTAAMVLLVGAVIFLFLVYHRRHLNAQREMHLKETKHQEQLMFSNLKTLEEERRRFAEDLHDEIGASLSAIRLYVGSIENQLEQETLKTQMQEVKATIDQSMASARRIAHNILPPGLEIMGLTHVINDMVKQLNGANSVETNIIVKSDVPKLQYQKELILYRVLQELFNNTLKHAKATQVNISFDIINGAYLLIYEDNGMGFDLNGQQHLGIGLSNLNNRVRLIGGKYQVNTAPGQGFKSEITVPLSEN